MTTINIPPDDLGTQALKSANTQPSAPKAVDRVPPYPSVEPANTETGAKEVALPSYERRRGDRRKKNVPVLLDTRSRQERRQRAHKIEGGDAEPDAEARPTIGIDVYT